MSKAFVCTGLLLLTFGCADTIDDDLQVGAETQPLSAPRVELAVSGVDDFLYVSVAGVRRRVFPVRRDETLDVTSWFAGGANDVRIQSVNTGGPGAFAVKLTVDGESVIDERCDAACSARNGIVFDQSYSVTVDDLPPPVELHVDGPSTAQLYINDAHTDLTTPTTLELPRGTYTVALGTGLGAPGAFRGAYFEQKVELADQPVSIAPQDHAALPIQHRTRVALLPVRRAFLGSERPEDTGVLTQDDIDKYRRQALATSTGFVEPFSFGLTSWDITLLPTVESTPLHRDPANDAPPDTDRLLEEARLTGLRQQYDIVATLYSQNTRSGDKVATPSCCAWGGGQGIAFPSDFVGLAGDGEPNVFLLHESLHCYESFNSARLGQYNGLNAVHGATQHGYRRDEGAPDFTTFYRHYMRNQVAEVAEMREDKDWPESKPRPRAADIWVGVFDTMRHGIQW